MPRFHLTRQAARDLRDIHTRSVATWGSARADRYLADIYVVLGRIAANPALGRLRAHRAAPFLMVAAERHFVIYVISFIVIGMYWINHHIQFHFVVHTNRTLIWINLSYLLLVSFLPFATDLIGDPPGFVGGLRESLLGDRDPRLGDDRPRLVLVEAHRGAEATKAPAKWAPRLKRYVT